VKIRTGILYLVIALVIFYLGGMVRKPEPEIRTVMIHTNLDSVIQAARRGYIKYDREALIARFGSIYRDTNVTYLDSLNLRDSVVIKTYYNEIYDVGFLQADTVLQATGTDSTGTVNWKATLGLETVAWWDPVYAIEIFPDLNVSIGFAEIPKPKIRWYDRFYLGVGLDATLKPGLQIGYGMNVGEIRRLRK